MTFNSHRNRDPIGGRLTRGYLSLNYCHLGRSDLVDLAETPDLVKLDLVGTGLLDSNLRILTENRNLPH